MLLKNQCINILPVKKITVKKKKVGGKWGKKKKKKDGGIRFTKPTWGHQRLIFCWLHYYRLVRLIGMVWGGISHFSSGNFHDVGKWVLGRSRPVRAIPMVACHQRWTPGHRLVTTQVTEERRKRKLALILWHHVQAGVLLKRFFFYIHCVLDFVYFLYIFDVFGRF